jgi:hypothetical protein
MAPCGTQNVTGIPAGDVDTVIADFQLDNPTGITKVKADDGTFTVTAVFPPCEATISHAEHLANQAAAASPPGADGQATVPTQFQGFDLNRDCSSFVPRIVSAGVKFVARYYSRNAAKNIGLSEAKALSGAGIDIVTVWESGGDHAAFFSHGQGADDATSAVNQARSVGQPAGTPVYFAVDFDASQTELDTQIVPYFQGVADGLTVMGQGTPPYKVGVYGSGLVCSTLLQRKLVTHTWLSMSTGFQGSKTFADWNIRQHLTSDPFGLGFSVDPDERKGDFGGFKV